jgi:7,8-dihydropterin-6-yl-methyl-4-(beta-D-ribofuranosyl)aminobenzene 5'-phosphate synthase
MAKIGEIDKLVVTTLLEDYAGYGTSFWGQHGVSFLVDITLGNTTKRILFDTGQSSEPIIHNLKILGIEPNTIDMIAISHCHFDHTGGLVGMLKQIKKEDVPVLAHPGLFRPHFIMDEPDPGYWLLREVGMIKENSEENVRKYGGYLTLVAKPFELMPGVLWSGEVERVTDFEKTVTLAARAIREGEVVEDQILDDISLAVNVKDEGLFVISGCSHAGIVNIVKQSMKISQIEKVRAVIGGFHLVDASEDRVRKTAKALKNLGVEKVYTGHCTGFEAEMAICGEFRGNFVKLQCGKVIQSHP